MTSNVSPHGPDSFALPETIAYLSDNRLSHDLIDTIRWATAPDCPRCRSHYIKEVKTNVFRQLYRCIDCGYMFNSLSGTIFQGAKMPLYKYFHFFILHNALGAALTLRDLSFALDISHKTASLLVKRAADMQYGAQFARIDAALRRSAAAEQQAEGEPAENDQAGGGAPSFFSYCRIKSIVVHEALFLDYLRSLMKRSDLPQLE